MNQYQKGSDLKNSTKEYLAGKWRVPVFTALISSVILFSLDLLAAATLQKNGLLYSVLLYVFSFLLSVLSTLFQIGRYYIYLNIVSGRDYSVSDLFFAFRTDFSKSVTVASAIALIKLVCLLPYYICSYFFLQTSDTGWALLMFASLILGAAVCVPVTLALSMAPLLLLDFPQYSPSEILQRSVQIMNGNKSRLFLLELSFLPLYFLCAFSLGLGYLWLTPYMQMTYVLFYLDLMRPRSSHITS